MPQYANHLDILMRSHVAGWAAKDGQPFTVAIRVNDREIGQVALNVQRPGLVPHGISPASGFSYSRSRCASTILFPPCSPMERIWAGRRRRLINSGFANCSAGWISAP
jgi:hypothetical protein